MPVNPDLNPEIYLRKVRENVAKHQGAANYEALAAQRGQAAVDRAEAEFVKVPDPKQYERRERDE